MAKGVYTGAILLLTLLSFMAKTEAAPTQHLCGHQLVDTLKLVCKGKGFYQGHPRGSHLRKAGEQNTRHRRTHTKGIVEKCCFNRCSYNDLQQYCNN